MKSQHGLNLGYVIFGFLTLVAIQAWIAASGIMVIDYSRFLELFPEHVSRTGYRCARGAGQCAQARAIPA